jgi:pre-rRNA-processing protein TSR1
LLERAQQDLEFPDETDTPVDQEAKARFQKFKGLKSLKSTQWDPYENLPIEYSKLFEFKNMVQSRKLAIQYSLENGLKISGRYVKLTIKGVLGPILDLHPKEVPIVFLAHV